MYVNLQSEHNFIYRNSQLHVSALYRHHSQHSALYTYVCEHNGDALSEK